MGFYTTSQCYYLLESLIDIIIIIFGLLLVSQVIWLVWLALLILNVLA
jgi:hypothetical protein